MGDAVLTLNAGSSCIRFSLFEISDTAGIGERAPAIREMVRARPGWLGVALDPAANGQDAAIISRPESRVTVRVIATDEEAMIARHTVDTIKAIDSHPS